MNPGEKADLIAEHMDRCADATRALNTAFANWHTAVILERHSEPERWREVVASHWRLRAALHAYHQDFPDGRDASGEFET